MVDYKPNSFKYKERQKQEQETQRQKKIVTGVVKTKKKSELRKLGDVFVSEDTGKVKDFVLFDVLIPAVKKAISDIVTNGIDMILYGDTGPGRSKKLNYGFSRDSYRNYNEISNGRTPVRTAVRNAYNFDDIVLDTRGEAEAVLMQMDEIVDTYGFAKVADLYDLVGVTSNYTDNNYGWFDIRSASVIRVREGYMIKLPRALPID